MRLVTLTGAAGSGKTRPALQAGAELIEQFADGVFVVGLVGVADTELVLPTVAQTLGVTESGAQPLADVLPEFLHDKQTLLVLDNLEHLLEAAPSLGDLLVSAPGAEAPRHQPGGAAAHGRARVPRAPAVAARPRSAPRSREPLSVRVGGSVSRPCPGRSPRLEVSAENAAAIAEICVRLDGLPLADRACRGARPHPDAARDAEAARTAAALLTGGARDSLAPADTRGAIDWSYELLDEDARQLLARLSVFAGGCTLEAAEAVCDATLDGLEALIDENLLQQHEQPWDGQPDFRCSRRSANTQRSGSKLDEGREIRRRHAEHPSPG